MMNDHADYYSNSNAPASLPPDRLRASDLDELLLPDYMDRLRYAQKPLQAYGALFSWDTVLSGLPEMKLAAWCKIAEENELPPPDLDDVVRTSGLRPERALARFLWDPDNDFLRCQKLAFEFADLLGRVMVAHEWEATDGAVEWLKLLRKYEVPCLLCSPLDEYTTEQALEKAGLAGLFDVAVTSEDGCETAEQAFLLGCLKIHRPPSRVVAFVDEPTDVMAALDAYLKPVAVYGKFPAYEMRPAYSKIASLGDLTVMSMREFFADEPPR
jgi:beta-phosphoglucomutase-like phosphatase (HAD superfamily)